MEEKQSGEREERKERKREGEEARRGRGKPWDGGGSERGAGGMGAGSGAEPERSRSEAGAKSERSWSRQRAAALRGCRRSLRWAPRCLLPRRGAGRRGGRGRLVGEAGLSPERTVCACFGEGHRHEDGSNDLIFLFFPGTISAQIGRMK